MFVLPAGRSNETFELNEGVELEDSQLMWI